MLGIGCPGRHALPLTPPQKHRPSRALQSRESGFVLGAFLAVAFPGNERLLTVPYRPIRSRRADVRLWHVSYIALTFPTVGKVVVSGNSESIESAQVDHCLREAGAGGSNPLTPTNGSAILDADLSDGLVPELTEHDVNWPGWLAPG